MTDTTDDRITFHPSETGKLETPYGSSGLKYLPDIGAFARTAKWSEERKRFEMQTDGEGVQRVATMTDEALNGLHSALHSIGVLLANVDHEELSSGDMAQIGWTITGLAELAISTAEAAVLVRQTP
ncbi:MAG: hypothetical protein EPN21_01495 [Methylococcaceae bacterium]|nr:MAG: hypothetical protein EPN21_01495 [Methylococcaceae bacterium]